MTIKLLAGLTASSALAFTLVAPPVVHAQQKNPPLAEVAKKEAERRKNAKEAKKVITTKDLPESARRPRSGGAPAETGAAPAGDQPAGAPAAEGQKPAEAAPAAGAADAAQGEGYWRGRITQAREALRRSEVFAEALQSRINALTTDFVNRDNPIQRQQIGEERQRALDELARVKSDIEANRRAIADIEEEARKAGVPPGWLR